MIPWPVVIFMGGVLIIVGVVWWVERDKDDYKEEI